MYFHYSQIAKGVWDKDDAVVFELDSLPFDPRKRHDVSVEITTNNEYPYRNLRLLISQNLQDSVPRTDTLDVELADSYGKWRGSGVGGLHQLSVPYLKSVHLDSTKIYRLLVWQGMRDKSLKGFEKMGIKITEAER